MKNKEKEGNNNKAKNKNNVIEDEELLDIGNLNINQEVDIKENPNKHIADTKKQFLLKSNTFSLNSLDLSDIKPKKNKKIKRISYEDIYLGNDMLFTAPKSYPRDYEKNNKYILSFTNSNTKKFSSNMRLVDLSHTVKKDKNQDSTNKNNTNNTNNNNNKNKLSKSVKIDDEEENEEDEDDICVIRSNTYDVYAQKGESTHLKDFLISINDYRRHTYDNLIIQEEKEDKEYIDEDEKINSNIFYIENEVELNNLNYYSKKNKCNISYISLNLFIKKLCTENLKDKYPILYKSFIDQYQEFLPISSLIEKIIKAFNYYYKQINIEIPDLVALLNKIISSQLKKIQDNKELIDKLIEVYQTIGELPWLDMGLKKEIENINTILSSNSNREFDFEYTRYLISDRKRTKAINIRSRTKARIVNNKTMYKYPYFYIFDFSDEEIARNLTLISYKMMSSIDVNELWNSNFSKEDKLSRAPNVTKLIDRFDKLMYFIIEDICSYETIKSRVKAITKWVNIAKKCKDLHNYNDLLIINQCFNNYLLKKLISTWKKLPKSTLTLIGELNKFCSNQQCYVNIRREIVGCKFRAYIPYLGILLKEIVDIEDKYKYLEKFGDYTCINCIKLQKIYMEVKKFFAFKNYSFTFMQINDLNILNQLNPKEEEEIEELIAENEKNKSTFRELLQTQNKKKRTKSDIMFYC